MKIKYENEAKECDFHNHIVQENQHNHQHNHHNHHHTTTAATGLTGTYYVFHSVYEITVINGNIIAPKKPWAIHAMRDNKHLGLTSTVRLTEHSQK